jgi:ABC-type iron transport system FetAB permease component
MNVSSVVIPLFLSLSITYCSFLLHQEIYKELVLAIFRLVCQLLLLSYILTWIFNQQGVFIGCAAAAIMTVNASLNVKSRVKHQYPGIFLDNLTCLAIIIWPLCALGSQALYGQEMGKSSLFLPLLGMLLGNTLNGLSQGLDFFTKDLKEKLAIEQTQFQIRLKQSALMLKAADAEAAGDTVKADQLRKQKDANDKMLAAAVATGDQQEILAIQSLIATGAITKESAHLVRRGLDTNKLLI